MHKSLDSRFMMGGLAVIIASLACSLVAPAPTAAPPAADVATTTAALPTLGSTAAPDVTPTEDAAAIQTAAARDAKLKTYVDKGYLDSASGTYTEVTDFKQESAKINYFRTWSFDGTYNKFVFGGHFKWSTASSTPDLSGCGVVFGLQDSGDKYAVFLDRSRIAFLRSSGGQVSEVGKTRGSGTVSYGNPGEADFVLIVSGQKAYASADGAVTDYTLSADQTSAGQMGLSVLSGTNKDYGTRCEITQAFIWEPNP